MPIFIYEVSDAQSKVTNGTITAASAWEARELLREQGAIVQRIVQQCGDRSNNQRMSRASRNIRALPFVGRRRRYQYRVALFARELATLLSVGMPLVEALETLARQHHGGFRLVLLALRDRVTNGQSLAAAMRESPDGVFDRFCVQIVAVGEESGTLEESLTRLAEFRLRWQQLSGKLLAALIYPAIVLASAISVSLFLMTFVVPSIIEPLIEQGRDLPLPTRIVKAISDAVRDHGWLLAAGVVLVVTLLTAATRMAATRTFIDRLLLRVPLLGVLILKSAIARVAVVMATMLRSGIVFTHAVDVAADMTGNAVLRHALMQWKTAIVAGGDVAGALHALGVFPPLVAQLLAVGQQSGQLEPMLERLADDYDRQVALAAQHLASILEPLLILAMAIIVLLISLATLLPILEAGNALE